ncbi:hypothetical protein ACTNEN_09505 [Oribacterium sp. HCP28S3_H8]|uniref:hypothetical protein n=1 Tax=Oribacterium sp. HCP28S3_H8 TaxID=3438945 RepID=UPI003F8B4A6B
MAWSTPKTDWKSTDYFNRSDYNRIKNNLEFLQEQSLKVLNPCTIADMGNDVTDPNHIWDPAEFNLLEENLKRILSTNQFDSYQPGTARVYTYDGSFISYTELNRLESWIARLGDNLTQILTDRKRLSFILGGGGF